MLRRLEQDRAKYAWNCIKSIKNLEEKVQENYKSYVKKASVLILTNGLGNALAFFRSKYKSKHEGDLKSEGMAYKLLYEHLDEWPKEQINKDILDWIVYNASSIQVFKKTEEFIALLSWIKKFADAELKGEEIE